MANEGYIFKSIDRVFRSSKRRSFLSFYASNEKRMVFVYTQIIHRYIYCTYLQRRTRSILRPQKIFRLV